MKRIGHWGSGTDRANGSVVSFRADCHSVEFSDWTGNPLFTCENVAFGFQKNATHE